MSKVIRMDYTFAGMNAAEKGGFVAYDDYAKLEAVVDASDIEICKLYDENANLVALLRDAVHRIGTEGFDAKWQEAAKAALEISDE